MANNNLLNLVYIHNDVIVKTLNFKKDIKFKSGNIRKKIMLIENIKNSNILISDSSNWAIDNYFAVKEHIFKILNDDYVKQKRFICVKYKNKYIPRVYDLCMHVIKSGSDFFEEREFFKKLGEYDESIRLTLKEIWSIPFFMKLCLIEKICQIINDIFDIEKQKLEGHKFLLSTVNLINKGKSKQALSKFKIFKKENPPLYMLQYLIEEFNRNRIKDDEILKIINRILDRKKLTYESLKECNDKLLEDTRLKISTYITAINNIAMFNWRKELEGISSVHKVFLKDPSFIYPKMDYESRDFYRKTLEKICFKNRLDEYGEAIKILNLCNQNDSKILNHIGYYLVDDGIKHLVRGSQRKNKLKIIYFIGIFVSTLLLTFILFRSTYYSSNNLTFSIFLSLISIVLISDICINIINNLWLSNVTRKFVPKMNYVNNVSKEAKSIVVIPALLTSEKDIDELVNNLEISYICNKSENLYFSLLFDYKDSVFSEDSDDNALREYAFRKICELNTRYKFHGLNNKFYVFIRNRVYYSKEKIYMGWERKRGKLMEFIKFLRGRDSSYNKNIEDYEELKDIKYIITIDSDTRLIKDSAFKLIGSIDHILNRAIVKTVKGRKKIIRGYGIIQPKVSINSKSSLNTIYSKIFSENTGFSYYESLSCDIYQDVFGKSIFTGKGIINVDVFDEILWDVIPENRVLSHDLIEGCFTSVSFVSDVEVREDFPSNPMTSFTRLHRWVRGDFQLIPYLFKGYGLGFLSKYKIIDNLRRSIIPISIILITVMPFFNRGININSIYGIVLCVFIIPVVLNLGDFLVNRKLKVDLSEFLEKTKIKIIQGVISFSLMPFQAYIVLDAICRASFRMIFSKKNLLEWKTANEVEKNSHKKLFTFLPISIASFLLMFLGYNFKYYEIILPSFFWFISPIIILYISTKYVFNAKNIRGEDELFLRSVARSTFAYFEDFVSENTNYLVCDNYQEEPNIGIAKRTSPTNIGMSLTSFVLGRDFGFITLVELIEKLSNIINSIDSLPVYRGHLYNWYDIENSAPIGSRYVSTVDSGNLLASYYLTKESIKDILNKPLIHKDLVKTFEEMCYLSNDFDYNHVYKSIIEYGYNIEKYSEYIEFLTKIQDESKKNISDFVSSGKDVYWHIKINESATSFLTEIKSIICFIDEYNSDKIFKLEDVFINTPVDLLEGEILKFKEEYKNSSVRSNLVDEKLDGIIDKVRSVIFKFKEIENRISRKIDCMDFKFLYNFSNDLFSIGYDCEKDSLSENHYDLLCSEVRIASFLSIAKGDVPLKHWFNLRRNGFVIKGNKTLFSWTGTMFEYLMPMLYMNAYPDTMFYSTYKGCVTSQIKYAKNKKIPFGISESCFHEFDNDLNYQYKAFGVPDLSIKKDFENIVVSPYSSIMSTMVDFNSSLKNLKYLKVLGAYGKYGFYESIDFTPSRLRNKNEFLICKTYMAHHQGMSFMALSNVLMKSICQNRFEKIACVQSIQEILQEKINNISIKDIKTKTHNFNMGILDEEFIPRIEKYSNKFIPNMQVYSNEVYTLCLSSSGGGYIKYRDKYLSKFTNDFTREESPMSLYIKDLGTDEFFSNTYLPCKNEKFEYTCEFNFDKTKYISKSKEIQVTTEVYSISDKNLDIRRVIVKNLSLDNKNLELTSYFESDILGKEVEYLKDSCCLVSGENDLYCAHGFYVDKDLFRGIDFEFSKEGFIGRGGSVECPISMGVNSNYGCYNLNSNDDTILSLRTRVMIKSHEHISFYIINSFGKSKDEVVMLIDKYNTLSRINNLIKSISYNSKLLFSKFRINPLEMRLFDFMTSKIIYGNLENKNFKNKSLMNINDLLSHGINPNIPIVSIEVLSCKDLENVELLIKLYDYFKYRRLDFNLIILNSYLGYDKSIEQELDRIILKYNLKDKVNVNYGIYIILSNLYKNTCEIVKLISNVFVVSDGRNIYDQVGYSLRDLNQIEKEINENTIVVPNYGDFKNGVNFSFNLNRKYLLEASSEISSYDFDNIKSMPKRNLKFFNSYGGFSKDEGSYILKLNDFNLTPEPYRFVFRNEFISFVFDSRGFMNTWCFSCLELGISNNSHINQDLSELIYLKEDEDTWSPFYRPISNGEDYIIEKSYDKVSIKNEYRDLVTSVNCFIPEDKKYKVIKISIKNNSEENRKINLYYYSPILLSSKDDYPKNLNTYINQDFNYIYGENSLSKNFKNVKAYLKLFGCEEVSFTGSKREFLGINKGYLNPEGISKDTLSNFTGISLESCLCSSGKIYLSGKESKDMYIILGYDYSVEEINREIKEISLSNYNFKTPTYESNIKIKTDNSYLDILINKFALYQNSFEKILLSESDEGFLNSFINLVENCLIYTYIDRELSKKNIIKVISNIYEDGSIKDKWSNITKEFTLNECLYDLLWIPYVIYDYIVVTGDYDILNFKTPYIYYGDLKKDGTDEFPSVYDKCLKIFERSIELNSENKWVLRKEIKDVTTLWFLYLNLGNFISLFDRLNDYKNKNIYSVIRENIMGILKSDAFNGEFYSNTLEKDDDKCFYDHIHIMPQVLSILSDDSLNNFNDRVSISIDKYLVNKDYGYIREYCDINGKLNDSYEFVQNTKTVILLAKALVKIGNVDKAYKYINFTNPILKTISREYANSYRKEPYIIPSKICINKNNYRVKNEDYNYPSALFYRIVIEDILGLSLREEGIYINSNVPKCFELYNIEYNDGDVFYNIIIRKGNNKQIKINGDKVIENFIKYKTEGKYIIDITI